MSGVTSRHDPVRTRPATATTAWDHLLPWLLVLLIMVGAPIACNVLVLLLP